MLWKKQKDMLPITKYILAMVFSYYCGALTAGALDAVFHIEFYNQKYMAFLCCLFVAATILWDDGCFYTLFYYAKKGKEIPVPQPYHPWACRVLLMIYICCLIGTAAAGIYGWVMVLYLESMGIMNCTKNETVYYGEQFRIQITHYGQDYPYTVQMLLILQLTVRMVIDFYFDKSRKKPRDG